MRAWTGILARRPGQVLIEEYGSLLGSRTKLVAFTQVSNALGAVTPAALMTAMAHAVGARVLLDGARLSQRDREELAILALARSEPIIDGSGAIQRPPYLLAPCRAITRLPESYMPTSPPPESPKIVRAGCSAPARDTTRPC